MKVRYQKHGIANIKRLKFNAEKVLSQELTMVFKMESLDKKRFIIWQLFDNQFIHSAVSPIDIFPRV